MPGQPPAPSVAPRTAPSPAWRGPLATGPDGSTRRRPRRPPDQVALPGRPPPCPFWSPPPAPRSADHPPCPRAPRSGPRRARSRLAIGGRRSRVGVAIAVPGAGGPSARGQRAPARLTTRVRHGAVRVRVGAGRDGRQGWRKGLGRPGTRIRCTAPEEKTAALVDRPCRPTKLRCEPGGGRRAVREERGVLLGGPRLSLPCGCNHGFGGVEQGDPAISRPLGMGTAQGDDPVAQLDAVVGRPPAPGTTQGQSLAACTWPYIRSRSNHGSSKTDHRRPGGSLVDPNPPRPVKILRHRVARRSFPPPHAPLPVLSSRRRRRR